MSKKGAKQDKRDESVEAEAVPEQQPAAAGMESEPSAAPAGGQTPTEPAGQVTAMSQEKGPQEGAPKAHGHKEPKEAKGHKEAKSTKEPRPEKEPKGEKEPRPAKETKEPKPEKEARGEKEPKPAKDKDPHAEDEARDGKVEKADGKKGKAKRDFSYTQNREVSWLNFDNRILDEALDETVPLFERLKFTEIFGSNLDEWFQVRVGGLSDLARLKHQPRDNKSNKTPSEQLEAVFAMLPALLARQEEAWGKVMGGLAKKGLTYVTHDQLTDADLASMARFFDQSVAPLISPLIVDPRHPFPNLRNGKQYVACSLDGPEEKDVLGIIEVLYALPRVVPLPSTSKTYRFTLIEDVITARLDGCFGDYVPTASAVIRVTRNADIDPDGEGVEEEEDYRLHMKKVLKKRQRLQPIRLEIKGSLDKKLESFIASELGLTKKRVFHSNIPLDLGFIYGLEQHIPSARHAELVYEPAEPQTSPMVDLSLPMRPQVMDHDVLLFYPYESMTPLLQLLREASVDDDCISIKITLYRVAKHSHLCESLIAASENGKEVTVLMELRARFDEANNIAWAERLEDAGCTVIYGQEGYKVHSKCCQITYHNAGNISRITCLGTGNFNEKTAKLYSDFMLLTAHTGIAEDANVFFRNLSLGNLRGSYKYLGVAPVGLKPLVMRGLDREIGRARDGQPAQVFMKMNSLTDRDVIDKIAEACQAGVKVYMIVRGICCIKAGIPGKTEGLVIREIAGRFLEHARVYAFGAEADTVYLSSADMMTRNTEHRVEIAYPIFDPTCRSLVIQYMNIQLADNVKARQLTSDGTWEHIPVKESEPRLVAQDLLISLAYWRAHAKDGELSEPLTPSTRIMPNISREAAERLLSLPSIGTYADEVPPAPSATGVIPREAIQAAQAAATTVATAPVPEPAAPTAPERIEQPSAPTPSPTPMPVQPQTEARASASETAPREAAQAPATTSPVAREPEEGNSAEAWRLIGRGLRMLFGRR